MADGLGRATAAKARSRIPDPIEDVLGELLGFDEEPPAPPWRGSRAPFPQVSPRESLDPDSGGKFPAGNEKFPTENGEGAKELDHLDELDELDAEILGMARVGSRLGKHAGKGPGPGRGAFPDPGDPLEKPYPEEPAGPGNSSGNKAGRSRDSAPPRPDLTFGDDVDDLVDSLGLGSGADGARNAQETPGGQGLRKGHTGIQELLGKTPEQPGKAELQPDPKEQEQTGLGRCREEPDFPFGFYEPSVASGTGQRRGRRCLVGSSSRRPSGATWLGLKDEDFPGLGSKDEDFLGLGQKDKDFPGLGQKNKDFPGLGQKNKDFPGLEQKNEDLPGSGPDPPGQEDGSWLSAALARKQSQAEAPERSSHTQRVPEPPEPSRLDLPIRTQPRGQVAAVQEVPGPATPAQEDLLPAQPCLENPRALPSWLCPEHPGAFPAQKRQEDLETSQPHQEDPGALPSQPHQDSQTLQSHPCQEHPGCGITLRSLQARVEELENQVRTLELERAQRGAVLESSYRSQGKVEKQQERPQREKEQIPSRSQGTAQDHPGSQERDEQLTALQDRLCRQQRDAEREQSRLQEVVADLETRLGEREQLLEQVRPYPRAVPVSVPGLLPSCPVWLQERRRAAAERSRADSLRDALEEQRRLSAQLLAMERVALDEAKGTWLEEQRAELQDRSEERRRLAAAWAEFHTRERLSRERAEQDKERALGMESALRSLAKEQAELKFRGRELRSKEEQLARDREELDEAQRELRLEKEKVLRAEQRLREREEQIHALAERSEQQHQDGERALREARSVQAEQRERLQALREQREQLRQQEQRLHQDRLSLERQREQLQRLRDELSPAPGTLLGTVPINGLAPVAPGLLPPVGMFLGDSRDHPGSAALYGHLLLLKHRAQMGSVTVPVQNRGCSVTSAPGRARGAPEGTRWALAAVTVSPAWLRCGCLSCWPWLRPPGAPGTPATAPAGSAPWPRSSGTAPGPCPGLGRGSPASRTRAGPAAATFAVGPSSAPRGFSPPPAASSTPGMSARGAWSWGPQT
ncbi:fas-binding factor 1 homolog isoform X2 [Parus major]|uniref:fas-binding factor 1 homolog isoform X2 n=1 Tax=Parus major TaxID=9157 RepID=UPI001443B931|nr:fas-binding factor 1 homolog isoform X2 [Parus major]